MSAPANLPLTETQHDELVALAVMDLMSDCGWSLDTIAVVMRRDSDELRDLIEKIAPDAQRPRPH